MSSVLGGQTSDAVVLAPLRKLRRVTAIPPIVRSARRGRCGIGLIVNEPLARQKPRPAARVTWE